jgi:hypothetical protein
MTPISFATKAQPLIRQSPPINLQILIAIVGLTLLLFVFTLTFTFSPLNGEDYALTGQLDGLTTLERALWIVHRSVLQVSSWNARFGEQLSIFWLSVPDIYFTMANTVTFLSFGVLLALFSVEEKSWSISRITVATFLSIAICYMFWPRLEFFFWRTTAAGYFQPLTMTLLVVLFFHSSIFGNALIKNKIYLLAVLPLGFLSGFSFENIPPAVAPYLALRVFFQYRDRNNNFKPLTVLLIVYLVGWITLMFMPSTSFRADWYRIHMGTPPISIDYLLRQAVQIIKVFITTSSTLLGLLIILFFWCSFRHKESPLRNLDILALGLPALLCGGVLLVSPYIEPRAFSLAWAFVIIFIVRLIDRQLSYQLPRLFTVALLCITLASTCMSVVVFKAYFEFSEKVNSRFSYIKSFEENENCKTGVGISLIKTNWDARILNNREEWMVSNPDHLTNYFKCKIVIDDKK